MYISTDEGQQKMSDQLQADVSYLTWVLETELRHSARAACARVPPWQVPLSGFQNSFAEMKLIDHAKLHFFSGWGKLPQESIVMACMPTAL